jgi:hypothetical protein
MNRKRIKVAKWGAPKNILKRTAVLKKYMMKKNTGDVSKKFIVLG